LVGVVAGAPFYQNDWLNPRVRQLFEILSQGRAITEIAADKPFTQSDWVTPAAIPIIQPEQVGKSISLVEAGPVGDPFAEHKWPNPEPRRVQATEQVGKSVALVETATGDPFYQSNWANPRLAVIAQYPAQGGIPAPIFVPLTQKPASSGSVIPEPLGTQQPFQTGVPLGLMENAGEKPHLQTDWITPPAAPTIQIEQVSKSIALVEAGAVAAPFAQYDWPNPTPATTAFATSAIPTANMVAISSSFVAAWAKNTNTLLGGGLNV
jgi:hypothetical protein